MRLAVDSFAHALVQDMAAQAERDARADWELGRSFSPRHAATPSTPPTPTDWPAPASPAVAMAVHVHAERDSDWSHAP